jgi:hypothetical protein
MKKTVLSLFFAGGLILGVCAKAQVDDPGQDPDLIPLDPGSWVLVAAGVGYGVKKWKDEKRSKKIRPDNTAEYTQAKKNGDTHT